MLGAIVITIADFVILRRLRKLAEKTHNKFDDFFMTLVRKIGLPLAYLGLFYLAANILVLEEAVQKAVNTVGIGILTIFTARFIILLASFGFN